MNSFCFVFDRDDASKHPFQSVFNTAVSVLTRAGVGAVCAAAGESQWRAGDAEQQVARCAGDGDGDGDGNHQDKNKNSYVPLMMLCAQV